MFINIVATNKFSWATPEKMFLGDIRVGNETANTSNNDVNLE